MKFIKKIHEVLNHHPSTKTIKILNDAVKADDLKQVDSLISSFISKGIDSYEYEPIYLILMDYIPNMFRNFSSESYPESIFTGALDLFWHQDTPLKKLDLSGQKKLYLFLEFVATYKFESDGSDELFFAISKSMDLIKYQSQSGKPNALLNLYLNHFNRGVKDRAIEYKQDLEQL